MTELEDLARIDLALTAIMGIIAVPVVQQVLVASNITGTPALIAISIPIVFVVGVLSVLIKNMLIGEAI